VILHKIRTRRTTANVLYRLERFCSKKVYTGAGLSLTNMTTAQNFLDGGAAFVLWKENTHEVIRLFSKVSVAQGFTQISINFQNELSIISN